MAGTAIGLWFALGRYLRAAAIAASLALAIEIGQRFVGRTPSVADLVTGLIGIVLGLAGVRLWRAGGSSPARVVHAGLALAAMLVLLQPALATWQAQRRRDQALPLLADFEDERELRLWLPARDGSARTVQELTRGHASSGTGALQVSTPRGNWMGVEYQAGDCDFRPYAALAYDVYNPGPVFRLGLRIDDRDSRDYGSRFQATSEVHPGWNHFRHSLEEIRTSPQGRDLDLSAVRRLKFYLGPNEPPRVFILDHVRLLDR